MKPVLDFLKSDGWRKLAALVLACLVYGAVRLQLQEEDTFDKIEIEVLTEDDGTVVLNNEKRFASLTVQGTKRALDGIKSNRDIKIVHTVDSGTPPGPYTFTVRPNDVELPTGVSVSGKQQISPSSISVVLDRIVEKPVEVRVRINRENLPAGLSVRSRVPKPRQVIIQGAATNLALIDEVETEEIVLTRDTPMRASFAPKLIRPKGVINVTPADVGVTLELVKTKDVAYFRNVPIQVISRSGTNLEVAKFIDEPQVTVLVEGDISELNYLEMSDIRAFIEIDETFGLGETLRPVRVWLDLRSRQSCTVRRKTPEQIRVVIAKRKQQ